MKKKMHLLTVIDPDVGGEASLVELFQGKYLIDTHAFKLSKALKIPLIYASCSYDYEANCFRLNYNRIESQSISEMVSEYVENLRRDLMLVIGE